ncbi:Thioredoxin-1 [compost metagenome]
MLKHVNSEEFKKEVIDSKKAVLVDFYATWCPPCKMLAPVLERIANSRAEFEIVKINVDDNQDLANKYAIEFVPTMVVFKDGIAANRLSGYVEEEKIIELMSKYI